MERIEYTGVIDKSDWGTGPWQSEPDKVQWQDEATALPCLIVRGPSGALCGYVGVPESHQWFGKDYSDGVDASVHGGVTFADHCQPGHESRAVCHLPAPGESDNVWWLGFDCAHSGDRTPSCGKLWIDGVYRDLAYVTAEVQSLAAQAAAART